MTTRKTRDLCQHCWETVHSGEYAPVASRYGRCDRCGEDATLITRSVKADEDAQPLTTKAEVHNAILDILNR